MMHCNNVQLPLWRSPQLYVQSSLLTVLAEVIVIIVTCTHMQEKERTIIASLVQSIVKY